jgi:hypothetical protein
MSGEFVSTCIAANPSLLSSRWASIVFFPADPAACAFIASCWKDLVDPKEAIMGRIDIPLSRVS